MNVVNYATVYLNFTPLGTVPFFYLFLLTPGPPLGETMKPSKSGPILDTDSGPLGAD